MDKKLKELIPTNSPSCRVKYSNPDDLLLLRPAIEAQILDETDRLGIMDDLFALVGAGKVDTVSALKVIEAFKANEESYVVWRSITNCLSKLKTILCDTPYYQSHYKPYVLDLMTNVVTKVGWEKQPGEHHTRVLLRSLLLAWTGTYGHPDTVAEATKRFGDHVTGKTQVHADLRNAVYQTVAANGGAKALDQLIALHGEADLAEEKNRIERAIGAAGELEQLQRVLEFGIGNDVRSQDTPWVINGVAQNSKGTTDTSIFLPQTTLSFIYKNKWIFI